ncbi:hypothetical protein BDQ17DRAFT_1044952 [Cyathus striatus]|nr:hypothetical protein BDQ17DRAFT_1044952 [Cyathus striatus]
MSLENRSIYNQLHTAILLQSHQTPNSLCQRSSIGICGYRVGHGWVESATPYVLSHFVMLIHTHSRLPSARTVSRVDLSFLPPSTAVFFLLCTKHRWSGIMESSLGLASPKRCGVEVTTLYAGAALNYPSMLLRLTLLTSGGLIHLPPLHLSPYHTY